MLRLKKPELRSPSNKSIAAGSKIRKIISSYNYWFGMFLKIFLRRKLSTLPFKTILPCLTIERIRIYLAKRVTLR